MNNDNNFFKNLRSAVSNAAMNANNFQSMARQRGMIDDNSSARDIVDATNIMYDQMSRGRQDRSFRQGGNNNFSLPGLGLQGLGQPSNGMPSAQAMQESMGRYNYGGVAGSALQNITDRMKSEFDEKNSSSKKQAVDKNAVKYTYKKGDTFGQVIRNLQKEGKLPDTGNSLWGEDGDVAYYTQQLIDQGALDSNGNIIVGKEIALLPRK